MPVFRSFQSRLLVFFLGLFVAIQAITLFAVNTANTQNARREIDRALEVGAEVFKRLVDSRSQRLVEAAGLLSGDFAFKAAYATRDRETIVSALENHQDRIGADVMALASLGGALVADTIDLPRTAPNPFSELVAAAEKGDSREAASVVFIRGRPYQVVVVPLLTPVPDAWICIGFAIGDEFTRDMQRLILSEVSLVAAGPGKAWRLFASTLAGETRSALPALLSAQPPPRDRSFGIELAGETYVSLVTPFGGRAAGSVAAVLQRSLHEALKPFERLRLALMVLFLLGVALSAAGCVMIARTISQPVRRLVEGVGRVEAGNYTTRVEVTQQDEMGTLARAFNHMVKGLAERDAVRSLLGKVVSPAVAEQLLSRAIELGGEEREVTILFSDLRDFTAISEARSPKEILSLLNIYLTRMGSVVEAHGGVVDKYIGDALMALYGAPMSQGNDAEQAVQSALAMTMALADLNRERVAQRLPRLSVGIGINTAVVVVGNMGSPERLNYTVIGDGVNLASRLEGLTKFYGLEIVVSEATQTQCRGIVFRELGRVRVKGKAEPVRIFEPIGATGTLSPALLEEIDAWNEMIVAYRDRRWEEAARFLAVLKGGRLAQQLHALYVERVGTLAKSPPGEDWDGVHSFTEK